ncbi:hypothetical protein RFI_04416 [Reticulomyxa filosa]|uniref:Uncharacterized protein n=1 Tax=Reticulomyxa filosa TaxID=46433 RepID=X6P3A2_RETFI|nr:hypothetical protein RFI_04416 [Reticulomyxa filosa]|eukprot:ETO32696.1 hypothetical protein RFI_04416 [Reticulomyxa filosa]
MQLKKTMIKYLLSFEKNDIQIDESNQELILYSLEKEECRFNVFFKKRLKKEWISWRNEIKNQFTRLLQKKFLDG